MYTRLGVLSVIIVILLGGFASALIAEDAAPVAPAAVAAAQPSLITPDTSIFRRTPVINGVIDEGEWDTFYSYTAGDWQVTTYVDWDGGSLYMGTKSNKPIDVLGVLDANDDGWFHGDENYEFKAMRNSDGSLNLVVSRYESRNTKSPMASPVSAAENALVDMKSAKSGDLYMTEMRIPASLVRGFKLTANKKIGFQIAVKTTSDDSGSVPTNQLGDLEECTLVNKKMATLKPLELGFDLKDSTVARGEELVGKFHITNIGSESIDARDFVIAGEGKSGDYLSSQKIRIEGLPPKKHISHEIRTVIPSDMPVGSWAMGAQVSSGGNKLGAALISFDVVDPYSAELRIPVGDVRTDVKDVTFGAVIHNNCRKSIRGTAKITLPLGWEFAKNADTREFSVDGGGVTSAAFKAKPPLGEMGSVPVKIEVTSGKDVKVLEGSFTMVNP